MEQVRITRLVDLGALIYNKQKVSLVISLRVHRIIFQLKVKH
jgi:hypothetical protein